MTHTPTPWRVEEWPDDIMDSEGMAVATTDTSGISRVLPEEVRAANAAFIVRAVNNHDKLVEALRWYEEQASNCRKLGGIREGEDARAALDADGGQRARAALEGLE